jgi:hypothetical protein
MAIDVEPTKAEYLRALARMSSESLAILADLSKKPGIEKKLRENVKMLKLLL